MPDWELDCAEDIGETLLEKGFSPNPFLKLSIRGSNCREVTLLFASENQPTEIFRVGTVLNPAENEHLNLMFL